MLRPMDGLPRTDAPRTNREPSELARKLSLLRAPQVAPLTDFVEGLRANHPDAAVPYFDPTEAGTEAAILGLFEAPGPKATPPGGSGFVSADNNDQTAQNMSQVASCGVTRLAGTSLIAPGPPPRFRLLRPGPRGPGRSTPGRGSRGPEATRRFARSAVIRPT